MNIKIFNGMKIIKKNFPSFILVAFLLFLPIISIAQINVGGSSDSPINVGGTATDLCEGKICNPLDSNGINNVQDFIKVLLEGVIRIGAPIVALAIIYSGFLFVSARGKPEDITKAKESLMYTLIGAAILLGSWAIAQLIASTVLSL